MNLHPHGMNRAGFTERAGARIENTGTRRQSRLGDVEDIEERERSRFPRQREAAVHAPGGRHHSRAHKLLQDLGDKQVRRRGRLGDLALGRQTVARASQVDEAADGVVDLSKEVHVGPIMQRAWSRDEQLLAATLGWEFPVVLGVAARHHDALNATIWSSRCSCELRNGQKADRIWLVSQFHDAIFRTLGCMCFLALRLPTLTVPRDFASRGGVRGAWCRRSSREGRAAARLCVFRLEPLSKVLPA